MIKETAYAGVMTIASAVTTALPGPVHWNVGGYLVPAVPAIIGILSALLVRIIVVTKTTQPARRNLAIYNWSVTLLTILGAATYITDHQLGPGASFWTGLGCGAMGVGIIELAKSQFLSALKTGMHAVFKAMMTPPPSDGNP